jgi:hypothetical protein
MRNLFKLILIVFTLGVLFLPGIQHHWQTINDPYFVPADAVQYIPSFFKYDRLDPIPTTYIKEYYLQAVCPPLYKWLTATGAKFTDVRSFQLGIMYFAYAVFVGVMGRLGWILGGAALSFGVMVLTLTGWIFMGLGFLGGAPRMYAYPLVSAILYALVCDRPILLAAITVLGASLYPIVAVIGGLCLTAWSLLKPLAGLGRVSKWRWPRRFIVVTTTGVLTMTILIPLFLGSGPYGRRILSGDIDTYPETGPDGNYRVYDQLPYQLFGKESLVYYLGPMYAHGDPLVPWTNVHRALERGTLLVVVALSGFILLVVIVSGLKSILKSDCGDGGIRVVGFFAICAALHVIAWAAAPYLYIPARYFMFSLPFLITLVFPWSLYVLLKSLPSLRSSPTRHAAAFLAVIGLFLMIFGGRGNVAFSEPALNNAEKRLFDAIAALPKEAVIAGWPLGPLRKVEYVTRRNVFLTGDLHQVLHLTFLQAMRNRMEAVFDAYLSAEPAPVFRLRDEFGVTHLVVEIRDFTDAEHPPEYFAPWKSRIQPRLAEIKGREYLLDKSLHQKAALLNQDGLLLLDLAKLP